MLDLLWRTCFRWKVRPHHVSGDGNYGTVANIAAVEESGIRAYLGMHEAGGRGSTFFPKSAFTPTTPKRISTYVSGWRNLERAPGDAQGTRSRGKVVTYRARGSVCGTCSLKPRCTTNKRTAAL
jgi:hypothetical protein